MLKSIDAKTKVKPFMTGLKREIDKLVKSDFQTNAPLENLENYPSKDVWTTPVTSPKKESKKELLSQFLSKKESEGLTRKSVLQLKTRINYFIDVTNCDIHDLSVKRASLYLEKLLKTDRSTKSIKEYISAAKQFCNYLILNELLTSNPFDVVKVKSSPSLASSQRAKWTIRQLQTLFRHPNFANPIGMNDCQIPVQKKREDYWIPILLLLTGARTGEICQLHTKDVRCVNGIWVLDINDSGGNGKSVKNEASKRLIPIHRQLIELGFLNYVKMRHDARENQLFSIKPYGKNMSWSEAFGKRFAKVQKSIGLTGKGRPTLHSFRHTFIDKAQSIGIAENELCDVVGHTKKNITYGRYGKRIDVEKMQEVVNKITYDDLVIIPPTL